MEWTVREFRKSDIGQLLDLMQRLADFERYLDDFAISEADLIERGLGEHPQFTALVAMGSNGSVLGMAVYHLIAYTYDLAPDMILKELFVAEPSRGLGVGEALMARLLQDAERKGCRRIKWLVLKENDQAKSFYARIGGMKDMKWENWFIDLSHTTSSKNGGGRAVP